MDLMITDRTRLGVARGRARLPRPGPVDMGTQLLEVEMLQIQILRTDRTSLRVAHAQARRGRDLRTPELLHVRGAALGAWGRNEYAQAPFKDTADDANVTLGR